MYFTPVYDNKGLHMTPGIQGLGDLFCGPDQDPEFDNCTLPNPANLMKPLNQAQRAIVAEVSERNIAPKGAGLDSTTVLIAAAVVLVLVMRR